MMMTTMMIMMMTTTTLTTTTTKEKEEEEEEEEEEEDDNDGGGGDDNCDDNNNDNDYDDDDDNKNNNNNNNNNITGRLKQKCFWYSLLRRKLSPIRTAWLAQWLTVKASASRAEDPGFESRLRGDFSRSSHTSDLKIGIPVATLPGAWRYRVSARLVGPVSVYCDSMVESLMRNFYLCVAALKLVWADPSVRYTSMLLGR